MQRRIDIALEGIDREETLSAAFMVLDTHLRDITHDFAESSSQQIGQLLDYSKQFAAAITGKTSNVASGIEAAVVELVKAHVNVHGSKQRLAAHPDNDFAATVAKNDEDALEEAWRKAKAIIADAEAPTPKTAPAALLREKLVPAETSLD